MNLCILLLVCVVVFFANCETHQTTDLESLLDSATLKDGDVIELTGDTSVTITKTIIAKNVEVRPADGLTVTITFNNLNLYNANGWKFHSGTGELHFYSDSNYVNLVDFNNLLIDGVFFDTTRLVIRSNSDLDTAKAYNLAYDIDYNYIVRNCFVDGNSGINTADGAGYLFEKNFFEGYIAAETSSSGTADITIVNNFFIAKDGSAFVGNFIYIQITSTHTMENVIIQHNTIVNEATTHSYSRFLFNPEENEGIKNFHLDNNLFIGQQTGSLPLFSSLLSNDICSGECSFQNNYFSVETDLLPSNLFDTSGAFGSLTTTIENVFIDPTDNAYIEHEPLFQEIGNKPNPFYQPKLHGYYFKAYDFGLRTSVNEELIIGEYDYANNERCISPTNAGIYTVGALKAEECPTVEPPCPEGCVVEEAVFDNTVKLTGIEGKQTVQNITVLSLLEYSEELDANVIHLRDRVVTHIDAHNRINTEIHEKIDEVEAIRDANQIEIDAIKMEAAALDTELTTKLGVLDGMIQNLENEDAKQIVEKLVQLELINNADIALDTIEEAINNNTAAIEEIKVGIQELKNLIALDINENLELVKTQISLLEEIYIEVLDSSETLIDAEKAKNDAQDTELAGIQSDITSADVSLNTKITNNKNDIDMKIQTLTTDSETQIAAKTSEITAIRNILETMFTDLDTKIKANAMKIQDNVDALNTLMTLSASRINTVKTELQGLVQDNVDNTVAMFATEDATLAALLKDTETEEAVNVELEKELEILEGTDLKQKETMNDQAKRVEELETARTAMNKELFEQETLINELLKRLGIQKEENEENVDNFNSNLDAFTTAVAIGNIVLWSLIGIALLVIVIIVVVLIVLAIRNSMSKKGVDEKGDVELEVVDPKIEDDGKKEGKKEQETKVDKK